MHLNKLSPKKIWDKAIFLLDQFSGSLPIFRTFSEYGVSMSKLKDPTWRVNASPVTSSPVPRPPSLPRPSPPSVPPLYWPRLELSTGLCKILQ